MLRVVTFVAGLAAISGGIGWGIGWWLGIVTAGTGMCLAAVAAERAAR